MMDDQVLLADRCEDVAAMVADALGMARHIGHKFEVGPVEPRQLRQLVHGEHAVDQQHLVVSGRERPLHEGAQLFRHVGFDLEPDHRSVPPPLQRGLEQAHQVLGLFLDLEFGVADDAEGALTFDGIAGKQSADEEAGCLFERDQAHHPILARGKADEAVDLAGHADQRVHRLAVGDARKLQRHGEAEARNEREGMGRIDRKRRQQREDVVEEVILDPAALAPGDVAPVDQHDAGIGEKVAQVAPDRLLIGGELRDGLVDQDELFRGRHSVRAALGNAFADLRLDTGDADHEELVEVIGRDRQEPHPLQQRVAGIDQFLEHTTVEMQPGELAVDEALRACGNGRNSLGNGFLFLFNYKSLFRFHEKVDPVVNLKAVAPCLTGGRANNVTVE